MSNRAVDTCTNYSRRNYRGRNNGISSFYRIMAIMESSADSYVEFYLMHETSISKNNNIFQQLAQKTVSKIEINLHQSTSVHEEDPLL